MRQKHNPQIISLAEDDLIDSSATNTGRKGLAVESVVRPALVKQLMDLSYRDLSFLVTDSMSINTFTRITSQNISGSALQSVIIHFESNIVIIYESKPPCLMITLIRNIAHLQISVKCSKHLLMKNS